MKRVVTVVVVAAFMLTAAPAWSGGGQTPPSSFKVLKGVQDSDNPLAEMTSDDGDYFVLLTQDGGANVTSYQVTFTDIPTLFDTVDVRIILAAKGTPDCLIKMWHWQKQRFITVSETISLLGGEVDESPDLADPERFVRRHKARAKVTCTDDAGFALGTELLHFRP